MDPWRIAVRAIAAYSYLLFCARASGKRAVAQATPFDFVMALIIGDLIDDALWAEVSMARFATAAGALCVADTLMKMIAARSAAFFRLVAGRPRLVLHDGTEDRDELRHEQLNEGALAALLRLQDTDKWEEVREARVEIDGEVSVLKHQWAEPAQRRDAAKVKTVK